MSLFGTYPITVKRNANGNYDTPDGSWQEGSAEPDFIVNSSWQPASGKDQQSLPEGKRSKSVYKIYPETKLRVFDQITQTAGDKVISPLDGQTYEIYSSGDNQNNIISHFKYMCVRVKETG